MPREGHDAALLYDMLVHAKRATEMTSGKSLEDYAADIVLRYAIERVIQIIGEAAWRVSDHFKVAHPEIAWRKIEGQRHRLVHDYGVILPELIWEVATVHCIELVNEHEPVVRSMQLPGESHPSEGASS
ncbi:MAG: DUF86 domain-containing protein [Phycisphaerae bacterium]|nr:DUF86 domain-containing protein [Phycisphaerae bacterium]